MDLFFLSLLPQDCQDAVMRCRQQHGGRWLRLVEIGVIVDPMLRVSRDLILAHAVLDQIRRSR